MSLISIKEKLVDLIKTTKVGHLFLVGVKRLFGRNHNPNIQFPELISIEVSSICNLSCCHCPPHMKEYKSQTRKHAHINVEFFNKLMDEIDSAGECYIALHKDGEPLLHPEINIILKRVKHNREHNVYLTTNAQNLDSEMSALLIASRINVVNFSIGASSKEFYKKVRGRGYSDVVKNIQNFLANVQTAEWKPKVSVQIIKLPEFSEMNSEIENFTKFWQDYDVSISVWDKLNWGVLETEIVKSYRYPCYSLWHSFTINSNGVVTACCMDWKQELPIGDVNQQSIEEIWLGEKLNELRAIHIKGKEGELSACATCNYWKWQPMLIKYPVHKRNF
ncbi:MAG: Fe-S oxidoreductase containing radical SAM domain [Ignavibacteria bacterium]|nr:MAG: Fe-S oxidoreductase containing radical SAM domain [Ignavibacteria bacterium]KAF0155575.1 MAG: Fe-S oxidoreductase containing radical SAM domain [Ignavibacteria bacterium]